MMFLHSVINSQQYRFNCLHDYIAEYFKYYKINIRAGFDASQFSSQG